jgi:hypothetical protein
LKTISAIFLTLVLAGCSGIVDLQNSVAEIQGIYSAPLLAGTPTTRTCTDKRCRVLDSIEADGYVLARQKNITWVKMVDDYYKKRSELYPHSQDKNGANELRLYQRYVAEQMDNGKVTEAQWAYLVESKTAEVQTRSKMLKYRANAANAAAMPVMPQMQTCNTMNIGTTTFPNYQTTCH